MSPHALPLLALVAACHAAGSGDGAASADGPLAPPAARECALTVSFGSYAMGIDQGAFAAIEALLASDPAVAAVERRGQGREGETQLCAQVASDADAARLFHRIAALLPEEPRGPIALATRTGLSARAPARR